MPDAAAKLFSGLYALFSGIAFLSTAAMLFAPIAHRFLHLMHIDEESFLFHKGALRDLLKSIKQLMNII
jgi:hypothetical protein